MKKKQRTHKPTVKDIAREAQVSSTTVSLVLRDPETKRVGPAKRAQIIHAKKLRYRPNFVARNLVGNESRTIGLVLTTLIIPFYAEIAQDIIANAKKSGYSVIISSTREFLSSTKARIDEERQAVYELLDRGVDGFILCSALKNDPILRELIEEGISFVLALRDVEQNFQIPSIDYVGINNQRGGYLAVEHLLRMGHKRISIITGDMQVLSAKERLDGSLEAFKAYGVDLPHSDSIISGNYKRSDSYKATKILLEKKTRPTAIFVHADYMAMGSLEALRDAGIKVPDEMAVVGFDDIEMAGLPGVDLTTISQKKSNLGKLAVEILIENMRGESHRIAKKILLDPSLVIRKTCGYELHGQKYEV